jgi:hypothetical protein
MQSIANFPLKSELPIRMDRTGTALNYGDGASRYEAA